MINPYLHTAPTSIYIHIPFCQAKCLYCDFTSFAGRDSFHPAYFEALFQEIKVTAEYLKTKDLLVPLKTLYFGGGTPSAVPASQICRTLDLIRDLWGFEDNAEITVEANPGAADSVGLAALYAAGANRLSLGLQATQDRLLRRIGRIHTRQDFLDTIRSAREAGFRNISADLMVGLPGQTLEDAAESIRLLNGLDLGHLSFYSLIIEEGTPFAKLYDEGKLPDLPDEETERRMYELVRSQAEEHGLRQYEISNAARPGQESRHNLVYWRGEPYLGFGLAAAGYTEGVRRQNTDNLSDYISYFTGGEKPAEPFGQAVESIEISGEEAEREFFLLGFRVMDGVDLKRFYTIFGQPPSSRILESLEAIKNKDLVAEADGSPDCLGLTRRGLDFANEVFREFVE